MRTLPLTDPGHPELRTPAAYLWWIFKGQKPTMFGGIASGIIWMGGQALVPAVLGKAVDDGVTAKNMTALVEWAMVLLAIGIVQAGAGVLRHRFAVINWLTATFRTQQLVSRQAALLGASLPAQVATGDIVSVTAADVFRIGGAYDVTARAAGALVAFVLVAAILLQSSITLGLIVLIGVPVLTLAITPLLRPLQRRQYEQRQLVGELTTLGSDTVAGLRVLRGIGGEETFLTRFREVSQRVRFAGVKVAKVQATLDAVQVLLPGIFIVAVTWIGARYAVEGTLSVGELVAFYGYAAFLVTPLRTATETADKVTTALVSAGRVVAVLRLKPLLGDPEQPAAEPPPGSVLADPTSGFAATPGQLIGIACPTPEETAALADRLGRYVDTVDPADAVTLGGVPLVDLPLRAVRSRILVGDKDPRLFTGLLRTELDPRGDATEATLLAALEAAGAEDVLDALEAGLDSAVEERGRSFSGGQRQRLVLARALVVNPEILVLDEPTSAVDAHTEAKIASRLREYRTGRTTVLMTTSPLLLEQCDAVMLLVGNRVIAEGSHRTLMRTDPNYRAVVIRGETLAPDALEVPETVVVP